MKQTIISRKRIIIVFFSFFIPLMFLSLYRIDYTFTAPGFNDDIASFITIDSEYEMKGSFHTTSVIVYERISLLQFLLGELERKVEVREFPDYYDTIDLDELDTMGFLMKDNALLNSLVVGITKAGGSVTYETYMTVYLTYDYLDEDTLQIGDKVLSVAHNTINSDNDPTAHAEMNAIREACAAIGSPDLSGCEIYATFLPCGMCMEAIKRSGIERMYYGAGPENVQYPIQTTRLTVTGGHSLNECLELVVNKYPEKYE